MAPNKPLPYSDEFQSPDEYINALLEFSSTSNMLQMLCGGVHILDFYTIDDGLFSSIIPKDWQEFLLSCDSLELLDILMRSDLSESSALPGAPNSFLDYVRDIRRFSLKREFKPRARKTSAIKSRVAVGMKEKKLHEVSNFADYVDSLCDDIGSRCGQNMTHLVDFGSGQNYLGRTLASEPYNRHVIAVERRADNIAGAKQLDILAGLATRQKVMRNKKLWMDIVDEQTPDTRLKKKALQRKQRAKEPIKAGAGDQQVDLRSVKALDVEYVKEDGKGSLDYVEGSVESGDLTELIAKIEQEVETDKQQKDLSLMAISIHSCGNLSHHGIRSLIMNPRIQAVAIVGCCYNLLTEKLGPPTYKHPCMRPTLQPLNGKLIKAEELHDSQGFPMSEKFSSYKGDGIRLNITARMMACQAPYNWGQADSEGFFGRHFFRAVLQRIFLERGVVSKVYHRKEDQDRAESGSRAESSPLEASTNPVIIGSLRARCYESLNAYVRGAVTKLTTNPELSEYAETIRAKMGNISDEEIAEVEARYRHRRKEISIVWSLMAFSANVIEAVIVSDRWQFLKEHGDLVQDCWVETVFDYKLSPRNLVVVGVKR